MGNDVGSIKQKYETNGAQLNERERRIWAAKTAYSLGYGGISAVSRAIGISRKAIHTGIKEMQQGAGLPLQRMRRSGGGRKPVLNHYPAFPVELEKLIEPMSQGIFDSPLRWTCKSISKLTQELACTGLQAGRQTVANQLHKLGYSLQCGRKFLGGPTHPMRDKQFAYMNAKCSEFFRTSDPILLVNLKRKKLPENDRRDLFIIGKNPSFTILREEHVFPRIVESLHSWWQSEGQIIYPTNRRIFIAIDWGRSDGSLLSSWKCELQNFTDKHDIRIFVSHFTTGTHKWNVIRHCILDFTSRCDFDFPMFDFQITVDLLSQQDIAMAAPIVLDEIRDGKNSHESKTKKINLYPDAFQGDWNYEIRPSEC